jgi:hypothetical protein
MDELRNFLNTAAIELGKARQSGDLELLFLMLRLLHKFSSACAYLEDRRSHLDILVEVHYLRSTNYLPCGLPLAKKDGKKIDRLSDTLFRRMVSEYARQVGGHPLNSFRGQGEGGREGEDDKSKEKGKKYMGTDSVEMSTSDGEEIGLLAFWEKVLSMVYEKVEEIYSIYLKEEVYFFAPRNLKNFTIF